MEKEERAWYIIQSYAGCENAAKNNLVRRIKSMNMEDYIFQVLIPEVTHEEKKKNGEVKTVVERVYPGYIFVDMIVTDDSWFIVRNTPMVTGFLGSSGGGAKPVPLTDEEIIPILLSNSSPLNLFLSILFSKNLKTNNYFFLSLDLCYFLTLRPIFSQEYPQP